MVRGGCCWWWSIRGRRSEGRWLVGVRVRGLEIGPGLELYLGFRWG